MLPLEIFFRVNMFLSGLVVVSITLFSAVSSFVLPRAARSQLDQFVFWILQGIFGVMLRFTKTFEQRDAILAYYAPVGLMALVPMWYFLTSVGFAAMYWALGAGTWLDSFVLSGSSMLTLGFAKADGFWFTILEFIEATLGLFLIALLIAYLPTIYSAFSKREQAVNMMDVRAGTPPSALEMLQRFNRLGGLDKLGDYWQLWESWFSELEESHTTLPALVFLRSPRAEHSWIVSAGVTLDAAGITLAVLDIPYETSAALCIRAGSIALDRIADYFDLPHPSTPHFPDTPISVSRAEFDAVAVKLAASGLPVKQDREQMWKEFAGWRVNYDRVLIELCGLVMAPPAPWSSDRAPNHGLSALFNPRKHAR